VREDGHGYGPGTFPDNGNRSVTLSGSYRIPLPSSISLEDVRNVQSGITSAAVIARNLMEGARAVAAEQRSNPPSDSGSDGMYGFT
jgi:hypothetical protein